MSNPSSQLEGKIFQRGADGYERIRKSIWNRDVPNRYPDFILRASSDRDVVEGVNFARERGLRIAVRGGGHNWFGSSLRDGGLLMDLGEMRGLSVDATRGEATVQPAITGKELIQKLEPLGLSFPVGHCPNVPLGGFILNGGAGWNSLSWGLACFNVRSLDIVTADGKVVTASPEQNTELYWAARGAGPGFFGAVVRFRIALFHLPKAILTSTCLFPVNRTREASEWAGALRAQLPPNVELTIFLGSTPKLLTSSDAASAKSVVVTATAFTDNEQEARTLLSPLATPPVTAGCQKSILNQATPYAALFELGDGYWPRDHYYKADIFWSNEPLSTLLSKVENLAAEAPSQSFFLCLPLPPPTPQTPPLPDAAFSMVGATAIGCYSVWNNPEQAESNRAWYARSIEVLEPTAVGNYVGETDIEANPSHAQRSFSPSAWKRLAELREKYDPSGLFHTYYRQTQRDG